MKLISSLVHVELIVKWRNMKKKQIIKYLLLKAVIWEMCVCYKIAFDLRWTEKIKESVPGG